MLDYFAIFSKGGALLWTLQFTTALKHNPIEAINALIRTCLLEERSGESSFVYTPRLGAAQTLKWTFDNALGLVFVAVYQKTLSLLYVDELLRRVKQEFVPLYKPDVYEFTNFDETFHRLLRDCEAKADEAKRGGQGQKAGVAKAKVMANGKKSNSSILANRDSAEDDSDTATAINNRVILAGPEESQESHPSDSPGDSGDDKAFDKSKISQLVAGRNRGRHPRTRTSSHKEEKVKKEEKADEKPRKKSMRNWNVAGGEVLEKLDYSSAPAEDSTAKNDVGGGALQDVTNMISLMDEEEEDYSEVEELNELAEDPKAGAQQGAPQKRGLLSSFMNSLAMSVVGKSALTAQDIAPALVEMKKKLMERNVAEEIAQNICDSVERNLEGQKLSSFTGVTAFVRKAFEDALNAVLNKRVVDVLHDIKRCRARGRPYVIVFCGVNGVGKSTNLAKIAFWLGQHNLKVLIAACDTFRSGAVEQLKTHCARLQVPLYERGYEKDPAKVAFEAVRQAQNEGRDVVLVDTAGRMQDNEPLMRALANLIALNEPNLVLFVGEALVGNDAVDQLVKFNRALHSLAPAGTTKRHVIDGIVLTKFDTIDEKVGAALSMVYSSGAPIMFVGCGQTYVDLKKLNVKSVVNSLLK